jgi:hypothetical protein
MVHPKPFAAEVFLTPANRRAVSKRLEHLYPLDAKPCFGELVAALDRAHREGRR